MKRIIITFLCIIVWSTGLFSQNNFEEIILEVQKNNTTLSALRKNTEAEKLGNKTGIYLANPEVEFHYLWGNPSSMGNRTDFSVSQNFDFPTAYRFRNQISDNRNEQAELEYQKQRRDILLQTRNVCYELIYTNALITELNRRLSHSESIANSFKSKYEAGDANILEFNKSQLNFLTVSKELEALEIEKAALLARLIRLNGGVNLEFNFSEYQPSAVPAGFDDWYTEAEQNNPLLNWLKLEIDNSRMQEKLSNAMSLPKLQAGYMSEKIVGEQFQGLVLGISIPLWENKNTVKYAKAQSIALESMETDRKIQFYNHLKALHSKATALQSNIEGYREQLLRFDNTDLLQKALDQGEISLIDYTLELSVYYESVNRLLLQELELNKILAELKQYI